MMMANAPLLKIIGKAMMLGSQQYALGSVLMSSSFSVKSFSKDQKTLQDAADALRQYIVAGVVWMISNVLVLWASYGTAGGVAAFVSNIVVMVWIWKLYTAAFQNAMDVYGLQKPKIF
jgi:uncharacterized membrane protein